MLQTQVTRLSEINILCYIFLYDEYLQRTKHEL
jgi:hypothetical protein